LKIILSPHRMGYVLDADVGDAPKEGASNDEKVVYQTKVDDASFIQSGMLFAMESEIQKHLGRWVHLR
jgi:hypothetical protein